ncbi:MAG: DUF2961 domain-containing protein [Armatimonadetes bacterium]|nr:DUF2961 domain-containing protein [Armatimonadota bacterium]
MVQDDPIGSTTLKNLTRMRRGVRTRRVSSWDRTGGNADARQIGPHDTLILADIQGAGMVTHLWFTVATENRHYLRTTVLRIFWDGEATPSVEAPLGDFFGLGHGILQRYSCLPFVVVSGEGDYGGGSALNCYFQMPFSKRALITVENDDSIPISAFYYYVDYEEYKSLPKDALRFHARWRRENPTAGTRKLQEEKLNYWDYGSDPNIGGAENYVILEAKGRGHFVGCNLSVDNIDPLPDGSVTWWGEGDDMIFIDGDDWPPSLHGTGSEDYFCHAWGMHPRADLYAGTSIFEHHEKFPGRHKCTSYRYHIEDPVLFRKKIRVTIEHGHANLQTSDYSSTAYWYQTEPHGSFPPLPDREGRLPLPDPEPPSAP